MNLSSYKRLWGIPLSSRTRQVVIQLIMVVALILGIIIIWGNQIAYAQNCATIPNNPIINCGFETGDFTGWVTQDLSIPFLPMIVGGAGLTPGFGLFTSAPTQGVFAALHGFDGDGPGTIRIAQDLPLPTGASTLEFDYRCGWDMVTFGGATQNRVFEVNIEPDGGGTPLQTTTIFTAVAQTQALPDMDGNQVGIVDISAFEGNTVRISFDWFVPESFTGPAFCQLDNVGVSQVDVSQAGDANNDGFVNLADLGVIINAFRGTPAPGNGDCNGDNFTNLADLGCVITK
ncbi:hypothetical protein MYX76_17255, partial [Desulfobacterota bacterium AH_259_B03_O07]|nr:hypothetical protein [Desulfobacterota bacterium AH_259_B03_O07]